MMQLFIALPMTAALRQTLEEAQTALRRQGVRGRPPMTKGLSPAYHAVPETDAPHP